MEDKCSWYTESMPSIPYHVIVLLCAVGISELAGGIGALFTTPAIPHWYASLRKPPGNPPNRVFGPVWTLLYFLMGIAVFLVWTSGDDPHAIQFAVIIFAVQLVVNVLWSVIFFGMKDPLAALGIIIFLWLMIATTIAAFWFIVPLAAALLIPYFLWTSFAAYLNLGIAWLNPKNS